MHGVVSCAVATTPSEYVKRPLDTHWPPGAHVVGVVM